MACPFCIENGMVKVLEATEEAYLIATLDRNGEVLPGCYFIIPKEHVEDVLMLPDAWWRSVKQLAPRIPGISEAHFNMYFNQGEVAGQRVRHVHMWVVLRTESETMPSYGLGLAALVRRANQSKS